VIIIGLDPGVQTGWATADPATQKLLEVATLKIHVAMKRIEVMKPSLVIFEDARKRKWGFGDRDSNTDKYGAGAREGVGSVKRDSKIWMEYLDDLGVPYYGPAPKGTKVGALYFKAATGYQGRTSKHGRDAGMLVIGMNVPMVQGLIRDFEQRKKASS
jgi:hypothetical protein